MAQFYKGMSKNCGNNLFRFDHIFLLTTKQMIISENLAIKIAEVSVILFLEVN